MSGTLDLFAAAEAERRTREGSGGREVQAPFSVTDLNRLVRELLDTSLPPLWVEGEVANWKRSPRGHCYFSLRDDAAQLRCVLFASDARRLPAEPDEGMRVRVFGTATLYEARGDFQLTVREVQAVDEGGLWRLAFERLRAQLDAEGLLAPSRKRPLPQAPARVGVVTSPVGAAIHDILHVIERRSPWTTVVLSPARVQGDGAELEIAAALRRLWEHGAVEVIIVGRGGGSVEDLWAFNREEVARAIAASPVPVVSAVGHEVDVTIADLVADRRAATPSAAAECVVPDRLAVRRQVGAWGSRMEAAVRRSLERRERAVRDAAARTRAAVESALESRAARLARHADMLEALSPLAALRRGFAVAQDPAGRLLRRTADFDAGDEVRLRVVDGRVRCRVEGVQEARDD